MGGVEVSLQVMLDTLSLPQPLTQLHSRCPQKNKKAIEQSVNCFCTNLVTI